MKNQFIRFIGLAACLAPGLQAQEVEYDSVKPIPIEQTPPRPATVLEFNGENFSVKVDPATTDSLKVTVGTSNALQQQMKLAVEQAISPFFSIIYRAEAGFKTEETQSIREQEVAAAYLSMLQSPALSWKPRDGEEVTVAYEKSDNLNQDLAVGSSEAWSVRAADKLSEKTSLSLTARTANGTGFAGESTDQTSVQASLEQAIQNTPLKLVLGPGWQRAAAVDGSESMRAFMDSAVIWKVDEWTSMTAGSSIGGSGISNLSDAFFVLLQHKVLPGTSLEMKAALQQAGTDMTQDGFTISAQSTVALAEALSAGLGVRYKMDQNPALGRGGSETFLSLSVNGSF